MISVDLTDKSGNCTDEDISALDCNATKLSVRKIGKVSFPVFERSDAIAAVRESVRQKSMKVFAFCNMHTFNLARRSPELVAALGKSTVFNDGVGIDIASKILYGQKFPSNLNGTDLVPELLASFSEPTRLFLVGSAPLVAEEAARSLESKHPFVHCIGCHHGFFTEEEGSQLVDRIRASAPDLVLVGMGNPRQELWAVNNLSRIQATTLCVGAFLDFESQRIARAPQFIRKMRSEWLYRLAREPFRLARRYLGGAAPFLLAILIEKAQRRGARAVESGSSTPSAERPKTIAT